MKRICIVKSASRNPRRRIVEYPLGYGAACRPDGRHRPAVVRVNRSQAALAWRLRGTASTLDQRLLMYCSEGRHFIFNSYCGY